MTELANEAWKCLIKARATIHSVDRWTREGLAADSKGNELHFDDPLAYAFSMVGVIYYHAKTYKIARVAIKMLAYTIRRRTVRAFNAIILWDDCIVDTFDTTFGHKLSLDLMDETIDYVQQNSKGELYVGRT